LFIDGVGLGIILDVWSPRHNPTSLHLYRGGLGLGYEDIRKRVLSMIAQLWWRFELKFTDWPFALFAACNDTPMAYKDAVSALWGANLCCLDPNVVPVIPNT
jgi:hypothetical protein